MAVLAISKPMWVGKTRGLHDKICLYVSFQEPLEVGEKIGVAFSEWEKNHWTQFKDTVGFLHKLLCYNYNVSVVQLPSRE